MWKFTENKEPICDYDVKNVEIFTPEEISDLKENVE